MQVGAFCLNESVLRLGPLRRLHGHERDNKYRTPEYCSSYDMYLVLRVVSTGHKTVHRELSLATCRYRKNPPQQAPYCTGSANWSRHRCSVVWPLATNPNVHRLQNYVLWLALTVLRPRVDSWYTERRHVRPSDIRHQTRATPTPSIFIIKQEARIISNSATTYIQPTSTPEFLGVCPVSTD